MKKLLFTLLALVLVCCLVACEQHGGETPPDKAVDVDLTALSSTMVYSEVNHMMTTPEDYLGKTVKMDGSFAVYEDKSTGKYYFACVIADATACCSQGLEFVLDGDFAFPADYPEVGAAITVVGEFDTYVEGQYLYCQLIRAKFVP